MTSDEDDYASLDLALAFFASVVAVFAFVTLTFSPQPTTPPRPTAGQPMPTVEAVPRAWSAAAPRTLYAWFADDNLVVLDMRALAAAVADPGASWPAAGRLRVPYPVEAPTPAGFRIDLSFLPVEFPEDWVRQRLQPGPEGPCPDAAGSRLTVFLADNAPGVEALLAWAKACGLQLRVEALRRGDTGRLTRSIGQHPDAFSRATIFR